MLGIDPNVIETLARFALSIVLLAVSLFLVWFATILDIVKNDFKNGTDKIVWFLFVMMIPPIGALLYLFVGRFQKVETEPRIRRGTRYRDIGRE